MSTMQDYLTAVHLGVPIKTFFGEEIKSLATKAGYGPWRSGTYVAFIKNYGPFLAWYNGPFSTDFVFALPIPVKYGNDYISEIRFNKSAASRQCYFVYCDENGNPIGSLGSGIQIEPWMAEYVGYWHDAEGGGYWEFYDNMPIVLGFMAGFDYNDEPRVQLAFFLPFSEEGKQQHPDTTAGFDYLCATTNDPLLEDIIHIQFNGEYYDEEQSTPTGSTGGGGGDFYRIDEEVGIPPLPTLDICDTNFISLFKVTSQNLSDLADWLWSDSFFDNIIKNWQSPMDNIISLGIVPKNLNGTLTNVKIGNVASNIAAEKLSTSFYEIDCGNKDITYFYKNYADYQPYTQIQLYLPYIGTVPLSVDDCMGGTINVVYHIDIFTGSCIAFIRCITKGNWHVLYTYEGNCKVELPITGRSFVEAYKAVLQTAASTIGGITSKGAAGLASGAINSVNSAMNIKPTYQRSGSSGGTAGYMSIQHPYLIFNTPQIVQAQNMRQIKGYISNLDITIGEETGFIRADTDNVDMTGFNATNEEVEMIKSLLSEGIYIN